MTSAALRQARSLAAVSLYETDVKLSLDRAFAGERVAHEFRRPGPVAGRYRYLSKTYDPALNAEGVASSSVSFPM